MDLPNPKVWFLLESICMPDIFYSMEICNSYATSKSILYFKKGSYNFHTIDFQFFPSDSIIDYVSFLSICHSLYLLFIVSHKFTFTLYTSW